ncbi:hypothetical protein [Microlunatus flavus]|uniref:Uncharacterized protein n=1 Tax=Microlunatus flavus TaxID=1036181 RepID=A0A1H9JBK0_9ACTN|nr:hypothetical protein [Microlunatus flavus]SEQ84240.1 hypothetical protein SAMN05421756_106152 [Microlunatus flavus]
MPDDWSWFWAGENGRDNLLREEIEGLQSTAYAASAQSARLSSQLRTLQGSIESRLQALSTAFDAYVELGDVREQLAGHPDTSAVRREALAALTVLEQGGVPEPLEAPDVDYWLVRATHEVIALASGGPAAPHGGSEGRPDQEHETFVVAALGWLGRGEVVRDRVAPLLVGDGVLAAPQVVLWRALTHGCFPGALPSVRDVWARDLDLQAATWDRFAATGSHADGPVQTLRWVQALVEGRWSPTRPDSPEPVRSGDGTSSGPAVATGGGPTDDRTALRRLVEALVGMGIGSERALLERARVLRARIEDPGAPEPDPQREPPRTPVTELVQQALLEEEVAPEVRQELVTWVRPGLDAAVTGVAASVAARRPGPRTVHTELGPVEVTGAGADAGRLAALDAQAVERAASPRSAVVVPGAAAAAALLVGVVLLAVGRPGWAALLLVVALVLGGVAVRAVLHARGARTELEAVRARTRKRVEDGRAAAAADESEARATQAEVAALARTVTGEAPSVPAAAAAPALS